MVQMLSYFSYDPGSEFFLVPKDAVRERLAAMECDVVKCNQEGRKDLNEDCREYCEDVERAEDYHGAIR